MEQKLFYLLMDWATSNDLTVCVRTGQTCNQGPSNSHDGDFSKNS